MTQPFRTFKFPALNVKGVGRIELVGRREDICAGEAKAIFGVIITARAVAALTRSSMSFADAIPGSATICDRHCVVGILEPGEDGELEYRAVQ